MKETKFKQTEVGMIPSDWNVDVLARLTSRITVGIANSATQAYVEHGIPMLRNQNIKPNILDSEDVVCISSQFEERYKNKRLRKDDLIVARTGYPGTTCVVSEKFAGAQTFTTLIASPNNSVIASIYLSYYMNSDYGKAFFEASQIGGAQKNVNAHTLSTMPIPYPTSKKEQQRIANALSDVDTLIANLEKLIAKKKNIKQGAMQQLLTGRKRLPGFAPAKPTYKQTELGKIPTDWECVNISKTCTIKARIGWQGLKSTEYLNSGNYILVTGTDFKNGFIDWSTCSYVSEWRFKQDKNIQIKKGDVLVTKDGTIGKVAFLNEIPMEGTLNSGVFVVRSKDLKKIDSVYLSLVFKSSWFDNFLDEITSGSTIVHLYQKDFVKFNFPVPSSIDEQTAIANVLSDMDTEIATLETKLAKYRKLKTGMMQQLLTGKIRLV